MQSKFIKYCYLFMVLLILSIIFYIDYKNYKKYDNININIDYKTNYDIMNFYPM